MFKFEDGRFYLNNDEGQMVAEITFHKFLPNVINVDHTFVDNSLRGQGMARKLVESVLNYAKENNLLIYPTCPYVVKVFEKEESLINLLYKK